MSAFRPAVKHPAWLRMAITGPAGAGKSMTALRIAHVIAQGGRIAAFDTSKNTLARYAGDTNPDGGIFAFDVVSAVEFQPERYVQIIQAAEGDGYAVLILDSLSDAWAGPGGILDFVDNRVASNKSNGWRDANPKIAALLNAIQDSRIHIIVTLRSKTNYASATDANGKPVTQKVGLAPIQRDGVEYDYDIVIDMADPAAAHALAVVGKTRCSAIRGATCYDPGRNLAEPILAWLNAGSEALADEVPTQPPAPSEAGMGVIPDDLFNASMRLVDAAQERFRRIYSQEGAIQILTFFQHRAATAEKPRPSDWISVLEELRGKSDTDLLKCLDGAAKNLNPSPTWTPAPAGK